jgi:hypothetical protein
MTKATKQTDKPHARIYHEWCLLPSWHNLSPHARALLVEMLAGYRPGTNGYLEWPQSRVAKTLHCGNTKADAVMVELEKAGWIEVTRAGSFSGPRPGTLYRLTTQPCDRTGNPPSHAYRTARPPRPRRSNKDLTDPNKNRTGFQLSETPVPVGTGRPANDTPVQITEALKKSLQRKGLIA